MINQVTLVGRITKQPELKYTASNTAFMKFSLAVQRDKEHTDFIPCTAWRKTAELLGQYVNKGDMIGVVGSIRTSSYEDINERKVYVVEVNASRVTFLNSPKSAQNGDISNEIAREQELYGVDVSSNDLPF